MRMWKIASLAMLVVGMYGCSSAVQQNGEREVSNDIFVKVENLNFYDARVYLRSFADRRRVGDVTGNSTAVFKATWFSPEVQAEIQLLAGGRMFGDRILVSPGDTLEITIPPGGSRIPSFLRR